MAILMACALALALAEASLQTMYAFRRQLGGTQLGRINRLLESGLSWQRTFLKTYQPGQIVYAGIHQPHQTRGWSMIPSARVVYDEHAYTSNRDGFRSLRDFADVQNRYEVIVVGDSFTFGDGLSDNQTWPYLLEQREPRLNVLNMAGTGYGVDQMYITLRENIGRYRPRLVIGAFISDDLERSLLPFRDYKKPRFVLKGNELVLTNTPIGSQDEVYREALATADDMSPIQLVNLARGLKWRFTQSTTPCDPHGECTTLNTRLFEEMARTSAAHDAEFMMLYLPYGREIADPQGARDGEVFFDSYRRSHRSIDFFNPRQAFLAASIPKSPAHYAVPETALLAQLVLGEIQKLASWQTFAASGQ
jgi:hypothetical protein